MSGDQEQSPPAKGPDFSDVDSLAKAEGLFSRGEFEKLFLLPPEFGGEDVAGNVVYVPVGFAAIKSEIDNNIVKPLVAAGKVTQYTSTPEYQGNSFIPIAIRIVASNPESLSMTINIWGDALMRDQSPAPSAT